MGMAERPGCSDCLIAVHGIGSQSIRFIGLGTRGGFDS